MIKVKLKDVVNESKNLNELTKLKLPAKVSYWINKIIKKLATELQDYEEERFKLIKELGERVEGKPDEWEVKDPAKLDKYNDEIKILGEEEISMDFKKIKVSELGEINIEPKLLVEWIFEI